MGCGAPNFRIAQGTTVVTYFICQIDEILHFNVKIVSLILFLVQGILPLPRSLSSLHLQVFLLTV